MDNRTLQQSKLICEIYFTDKRRFDMSRTRIQNEIMMEIIKLYEEGTLDNINPDMYSDSFKTGVRVFRHYQNKFL